MKTKNRAQDATRYWFQSGEHILIDANIWLFLYPPAAQPASRWVTAYSRAFSRLLSAKAIPVVDAIILSEYLNCYVRIEYDASWKAHYSTFKRFRQSVDAATVLGSAAAEVNQILSVTSTCDTLLVNIDLPSVLNAFQLGTIDFNDGLLAQNCRVNGWKLMTHDGDMSLGGIEVLTTNATLLKNCP
jgi:hypothetical protein